MSDSTLSNIVGFFVAIVMMLLTYSIFSAGKQYGIDLCIEHVIECTKDQEQGGTNA